MAEFASDGSLARFSHGRRPVLADGWVAALGPAAACCLGSSSTSSMMFGFRGRASRYAFRHTELFEARCRPCWASFRQAERRLGSSHRQAAYRLDFFRPAVGCWLKVSNQTDESSRVSTARSIFFHSSSSYVTGDFDCAWTVTGEAVFLRDGPTARGSICPEFSVLGGTW